MTNVDYLETNLRILHFGDLHAGVNKPSTLITKKLFEVLKNESSTDPFDIVVFSGDIIDKAEENTSVLENKKRNALNFIECVIDNVNTIKAKAVLVPGWHDATDGGKSFSPFIKLSNQFYKNTFVPFREDVDSSHIIRRFPICRLWHHYPVILLGLNSCDPSEKDLKKCDGKNVRKTFQRGIISPEQIDNTLFTVGNEELENSFIIIAFHHTPLPSSAVNADSTAEEGTKLLNMVNKLKPHLCLTGHWHYDVKIKKEKEVIFCGAGHTIDEDDKGSNQFNIIEVAIFAHQKDIFAVKQRPFGWNNNKWLEGDSVIEYSLGITKKIKQYMKRAISIL